MGFLSKWLSDLHRLNAARQIRKGMTAEFQDDKGRWYYSFKDEQEVPVSRLSFAHTHLQFMAAGLSAELFEKAMDEVTIALANSNIVKAGAIISDLTDLNKKVVNLDAMVNVIATYYVREDEDTVSISHAIHAEKCDFLKSETEDGRFFFRTPKLLQLLGGQTLSNEQLEQLWVGYQNQLTTLLRRFQSSPSKPSVTA